MWFMLVAGVLVVLCMLSMQLQTPTNEPLNLHKPDFELDRIGVLEQRNLDERIKRAAARNHRVAAWRDRVRLLAVSSPLIFSLTALGRAGLAPDLAALV